MKKKYSLFGFHNNIGIPETAFKYLLTPRGLYYRAEQLYIHFDNTFEVTPICKEAVKNGKWSGCMDIHNVITVLSVPYDRHNSYETLYNIHICNQLNSIFSFMLLNNLSNIKQKLLDNGYKEIESI